MKLKILIIILLIFLTGCSNSLDEKVGNMIITGIPSDNNLTINELKEDYHVAGFILMDWDIEDKSFNEIQEITKSLGDGFIVADIEGGEVNRIRHLLNIKTAQQYGQEYENTNDKSQFIRNYRNDVRNIAVYMRALGFNLNFAPVLDVEQTLENGVLSKLERSYSTNHIIVAELGKIYIEELQKNNIIVTAKHYPGHGHTNCDTFIELCEITLNKTLMQEIDMYPFKEVINYEQPGMIMVGLFKTPIDSKPAIFSKELIDILRKELSYNGVIISDDIMMGAVKEMDREKLTIDSINAGIDIILTTNANDVPLIHDAIISGVQDGKISLERIEQANLKINQLKSFLKT